MDEKFLCLTAKEIFYTAVMLKIKQLVNIVYDFPADVNKFEQELNEARNSLRKKKLLTESARGGINLNFALIACVSFCAAPETCEIINSNNYHATIYKVSSVYMLMEKNSSDEFNFIWFTEREILNKYVDGKINLQNSEGGNIKNVRS